MKYTIVVTKDEDDPAIYNASVPALQGCHTFGHCEEEAYRQATEAIEGYLEMLKKLKQPVPEQVGARDVEVKVA